MTTQTQQVETLIGFETGYSGGSFPTEKNLGAVDSANTKFHVKQILNPTNNNVQYSEFYKVKVECDIANERAVKEKVMQMTSDSANGYNINDGTATLTIKDSADDISFQIDGSNPFLDSYEGIYSKMQYTSHWYNVIRFQTPKMAGYTLTNAEFKIYAQNSQAISKFPDFIVFKIAESGSPSLYTRPSDLPPAVSVSTGMVTLSSNWTANTLYTISSGDAGNLYPAIQELFDSTDYIKNISILFDSDYADISSELRGYALDSADSNSGKYPELDLEFSYPTDYPYWINIVYQKSKNNNNRCTMEFEIEARWDV